MESMYKGSQAEEREGVVEKELKKTYIVRIFTLMNTESIGDTRLNRNRLCNRKLKTEEMGFF